MARRGANMEEYAGYNMQNAESYNYDFGG